LHRAVKNLRGNKLLNLFTNAQWFCTEGKAKQLIVVWYVPLSNTFAHGFGSRLRGLPPGLLQKLLIANKKTSTIFFTRLFSNQMNDFAAIVMFDYKDETTEL